MGTARTPTTRCGSSTAAEEAGAERLILCDTNGGTLPNEVARVVAEVKERTSVPLGIHTHNDAGCAVASALAAVDAGVLQVQGVVNGYGERTGNADLIPLIGDLTLKLGVECLPDGAVERLTEVAHFVAEVANVTPDPRQPYAGRFAFTHKAGLHSSGVSRLTEAYEHVAPEVVGNHRGVVASDLGGAATLRHEGSRVRRGAFRRRDPRPTLRTEGSRGARVYLRGRRRFDGAPHAATRRMAAGVLRDRELPRACRERVPVTTRRSPRRPSRFGPTARATSRAPRVTARSARSTTRSARRSRTSTRSSSTSTLEDYRVRVLDETVGTGATVRVLIDTSNGQREWTTVGVSENIIEASWEALTDGYLFGLLHPREDRPA